MMRNRVVTFPLAAVVAAGLVAGVRAQAPKAAPRPSTSPVAFTDVTARTGVTFRHTSGAFGKKYLPETMGAGVVVLDFDNDGRQDLFFANGKDVAGTPAGAQPAGAVSQHRCGHVHRRHQGGGAGVRGVRDGRGGRRLRQRRRSSTCS